MLSIDWLACLRLCRRSIAGTDSSPLQLSIIIITSRGIQNNGPLFLLDRSIEGLACVVGSALGESPWHYIPGWCWFWSWGRRWHPFRSIGGRAVQM
jgi:hypothetical protein